MAVAFCSSLLALAAVGVLCLPGTALAAPTTIAPSETITGGPVHSRPVSPRRPRRIVRLHVLDPSAYAQAKRAAAVRAGRMPPAAAKAARTLAAAGSARAVGAAVFGSLNEAGLSAAAQIEARGEAGDITPPDTTGAIGPSHYVEIVNSEIAAYKRSSLQIVGSPTSLEEFTGGEDICDPQIKYDPQGERWFYVAIRCDMEVQTLYMGFSKTRDPVNFSTGQKGGWCGYAYSTGTDLEDYPKLGLDPQHIIIGTNSFRTGPKERFVTAHILSAPKPASGKIESCPAEAPVLSTFGSEEKKLTTSVGHEAFTPEPATVADGSSSGYVVAADLTRFDTGKNIMIWRVGGSSTEPKLEEMGAPEVPSYEIPPAVPQPGTSDGIDSLDGRLTQAVAATDPSAGGREAVWTQHTVAGGAGSVVRWYELLPGIAPNEAKVRQLGTIAEAGEYVFNGAIAPTRSGGAVIDYNTGSASALVQIMTQSRKSYAPRGTMNSPVLLGESSAIDSDFSCPSQPLGELTEAESCRWGDYAGASVDPEDPNLVWGSNQLNGPANPEHAAQWTTRNFALEANDAPPNAAFTLSPNPVKVGETIGFDGTSSSDPDGTVTSYSWSFGDGAAATGATASHAYAAPGTYEVRLTVTDNAGITGSVAHAVTVEAPPAGTPVTTTSSLSAPFASLPLPPVPDSSFSVLRRSVNHLTGAITLTVSVHNAGRLSWLLTFQNGPFGVFAARTARCKKGSERLRGRCRPARIAFARGAATVALPGMVTFTVKPSVSARKALRSAARRRKGLSTRVTLNFQSSLGGAPVAHVQDIVVRLERRR